MRQLGRLSVTASWGATFFNNASSSSYVDLASSRPRSRVLLHIQTGSSDKRVSIPFLLPPYTIYTPVKPD